MKKGKCTWCRYEAPREEIPIDEAEAARRESLRDAEPARRSFWWEKKPVCILLLIFCFPAGLISMYAFGHFKGWQRSLITLFLIVLWLLVFAFVFPMFEPWPVPDYTLSSEIIDEEEPDEFALSMAEGSMLSREKARAELIGSGYGPEEADRVLATLDIDWRENAVRAAEYAASSLAMSRRAVYEQLTSPFGDMFREDEASWAVLHMEADWKENAVLKAESLMALGHSRDDTERLLSDEYGEMFTPEEARYAVSTVWGP